MSAGTPVSNDLFSQALQQALQATNMSALQVRHRTASRSNLLPNEIAKHYNEMWGSNNTVCDNFCTAVVKTKTEPGTDPQTTWLFWAGVLCCQGRWQSQMQQLRDMGIQDEELMLRALQATDGDIQAALELIFAGGLGLWGHTWLDGSCGGTDRRLVMMLLQQWYIMCSNIYK